MDISVFSAPARSVVERIQQHGHEAFFVGGCVRDVLLGRAVKDFDVTTNAVPSEILSIFSSTVPTGLQHGTVTVLDFGEPIEVTTYRIDKGYSDARRPDAVEFTSRLEDDLSRRDFTINAIAVGLDGIVRDPFHGIRDINNHVVRAVGVPEFRFKEDALRILRALRFAAQLEFTIDASTERAMVENADNLRHISRERIGQEMYKIAASSWWQISSLLARGPWLRYLGDHFIPLTKAFSELSSPKYRVGVFRDWVQNDAEAVPDFVAIVTFSLWIFMAQMANDDASVSQIANLLVWPKKMRQSIQRILGLLECDSLDWTSEQWRRNLYQYPSWVVLAACRIFDFVHLNDDGVRYKLFRSRFVEQPIFSLKDLAISGGLLMEHGFSGRDVGQALERLVTKVLNCEVDNTPSALLSIVTGEMKQEEDD